MGSGDLFAGKSGIMSKYIKRTYLADQYSIVQLISIAGAQPKLTHSKYATHSTI